MHRWKKIKAPRHWPLWGEFTGSGHCPFVWCVYDSIHIVIRSAAQDICKRYYLSRYFWGTCRISYCPGVKNHGNVWLTNSKSYATLKYCILVSFNTIFVWNIMFILCLPHACICICTRVCMGSNATCRYIWVKIHSCDTFDDAMHAMYVNTKIRTKAMYKSAFLTVIFKCPA